MGYSAPDELGRRGPDIKKAPLIGAFSKVSDGTRTHDRLDHNQELYQLSYAHRGGLNLAAETDYRTRLLDPGPAHRAGFSQTRAGAPMTTHSIEIARSPEEVF